MRVLLTGSAGFIGSRIGTALDERGHEVVRVDLMLASAHGPSPMVPDDIHRLDVRDGDAMDQVLGGVDVVCHQAAVHGDVVPPPRRTSDLDRGEFDDRCPVGGEPVEWELVGEDAPLRPRSLYAASKLAQEHFALAWSLASGGSVTALRYHNVYGEGMPRDTPYSGVAAMFRSSLEAGEAPHVYEDGRQTRDFVHVHDVAEANVRSVEHELSGFVPLNVCSGQPVTIEEVASTLSRARRGAAPVVTGQYRPGDVRHIVADPARATQRLGFTASVPPAEGLARFAWAPLRDATAAGPPRV
jgi:dTDP-L-rhamnose 4-epimerase